MPFSRKKPEIQVGLSGTALKYIAMATMLADHIGAGLLERIVYYRGNLEPVSYTHLDVYKRQGVQ